MSLEKTTLLIAGVASAVAVVFGARRGLVLRSMSRHDSDETHSAKRAQQSREGRRGTNASWIGILALVFTPNSVFGSFIVQGVCVVAYAVLIWVGQGLVARNFAFAFRRDSGSPTDAGSDRINGAGAPAAGAEPTSKPHAVSANVDMLRRVPAVQSGVDAQFSSAIQQASACHANMSILLDLGDGYVKPVAWVCLLEFERAAASERFAIMGHLWGQVLKTFADRNTAYSWVVSSLGPLISVLVKTRGGLRDDSWKLFMCDKTGQAATIGPDIVGVATQHLCCYTVSVGGSVSVGEVLQPWDGKMFSYQGKTAW